MKSNHEYKLEESRGLEQKLLRRYGDFEHVEKVFSLVDEIYHPD